MSAHITSIENHTVFGYINKAKALIADVLSIDTLTLGERDIALRINLVLENFEESINSNDANLISVSWLTEAQGGQQSGIALINTNLTNYGTQQPHVRKARIDVAAKSLDVVLNATAKINLTKSEKSVRVHAKALENNTAVIQAIISDYKKELDDAKKVAGELNSLQDKVLKLVEEKKLEITTTGKKAEEKLTLYMNEFDEDIRDLQAKYEEKLEKSDVEIGKIERKTTAFLSDAETRVDTFIDVASEKEKTFEDSFNKLNDKGNEILRIVSKNAFTHDYSKVVKLEKTRAFLWNLLAVFSMIVVVCFTIFVFFFSELDWVIIVSKIVVSSAFASISIYAIKQAAKHSQLEQSARKMALELSAFDPFIYTLSKSVQDELKQELVKRLFGNTDDANYKTNNQSVDILDSTIKLEDLLKLLLTVKEGN